MKNFLLLELNEFEFTKDWRKEYPLFSSVCPKAMKISITKPDMNIEFKGLDPWVQWPTIHNQINTNEHGQFRHGDLGNNKKNKSTIFSQLEKNNIKYNAWGIMNPPHSSTKNVFLSDPWSKQIKSNPIELEKFISPMRYLAENYHKLNVLTLIFKIFSMFIFLITKLKISQIFFILKDILILLSKSMKINTSIFFMIFELISLRLFTNYCSEKMIAFVFVNSAAHFQHNHRYSKRTQKTLDYFIFKIIKILNEKITFSNSNFAIATALTQTNSKDIFVYNFRDGREFISNFLDVKFKDLRIGMTNELNFIVDKDEKLNKIFSLKKVKIKNSKVFEVSITKEKKINKIFIQLIFDKKIDVNKNIFINNKTIKFSDYFYKYNERSGVHIPIGYLLFNKKTKNKIPNKNLMKFIFGDLNKLKMN